MEMEQYIRYNIAKLSFCERGVIFNCQCAPTQYDDMRSRLIDFLTSHRSTIYSAKGNRHLKETIFVMHIGKNHTFISIPDKPDFDKHLAATGIPQIIINTPRNHLEAEMIFDLITRFPLTSLMMGRTAYKSVSAGVKAPISETLIVRSPSELLSAFRQK